MDDNMGASASGSGSHASHEDRNGLRPPGFDPSRWLLYTIASAIDHPSVYMGGPSRQSIGTARRVLESLCNPPPQFIRMLQDSVTGYPKAEAVTGIWNAAMRAGHEFRDTDRSP